MEFNFVHLRITIATDSPERLALFLFNSSSAFAGVFRQAVCSTGINSCHVCGCNGECPYPELFGQRLAVDPAALKRYQKPPLPFVFSYSDPAVLDCSINELSCELVLVGKASHHIAHFVSALQRLIALNQADARIIMVESLDYQGSATAIASSHMLSASPGVNVLDAAGVVSNRNMSGDLLGLRMNTPLKIMQEGRLARHFNTGHFVRSLMRRVSALAYYYCDHELPDDFRACAEASQRLEMLEDKFYYGGIGQSAGLCGIMGEGWLNGDLCDLYPFLVLGEYLHLGKGASYGMGQYVLLDRGDADNSR